MVDLQNLKNAISGGPFSEDAKQMMFGVIDGAIAKGTISPEEKQKILSIIDLEVAQNEELQKVQEEISEMLEGFLAKVDSITQTASDNIDALPTPQAEPQPQVVESPVQPQVPQPVQ